MLLGSSQSSSQRPLGLSMEELFALDRQYRRIDQQQQFLQFQAQTRATSTNLNRLSSRSVDLISSPLANPFPILPSLEVHGYSYTNRHPPLTSSTSNYSRSNSIDQLRPPTAVKSNYSSRSPSNDLNSTSSSTYANKYHYRSHFPSSSSNLSTTRPAPVADYSDNRGSCKLRRQAPIKRESSRRILVRPLVHRRREPSISSSCESLDQTRPLRPSIPIGQVNGTTSFEPSSSLVEDVIDDLIEETKLYPREDSLSDDGEVNLYEMRVPIGTNYDTTDISVQLEGSKILVHCHTIEPTDRRGNYRKHELKTELLVPETVNDETIVAYLTEQGELIVEGKYHGWAWKEMKKQQKQQRPVTESNDSPSNGTDLEKKRLKSPLPAVEDEHYSISTEYPPVLLYYLRLPFETHMDAIRIQSNSQLNLLKIFIEQQDRRLFISEDESSMDTRSTIRICRLPRDHLYDYNRVRVTFLKENFIRIEVPIIDSDFKTYR